MIRGAWRADPARVPSGNKHAVQPRGAEDHQQGHEYPHDQDEGVSWHAGARVGEGQEQVENQMAGTIGSKIVGVG